MSDRVERVTKYVSTAITAVALCVSCVVSADGLGSRINGTQIGLGVITNAHVASNAAIAASKLDPTLATQSWVTANSSTIPAGTIIMHGGTTPSGYVLCDGATYNGTLQTYSVLYNVIGTTYGGTGVSSFKVPDLRGRVAVGTGTGSGMTTRNMGASGGEEAHQITTSELPAHSHSTNITIATQGTSGSSSGYHVYGPAAGAGVTTSSVGSNGWLNLMQPYTVIRFCIKL